MVGKHITPPEGNIEVVKKWYILPNGGLYATYHLLREPKTTIECIWSIYLHEWLIFMVDVSK